MDNNILRQLQKEVSRINPPKAWIAETRQELLFFARNHHAHQSVRKWFFWPALAFMCILLTSVTLGGLIWVSKPGQLLYHVKQFIQQTLLPQTPSQPAVQGFYTPALHESYTPPQEFKEEYLLGRTVGSTTSATNQDTVVQATVSSQLTPQPAPDILTPPTPVATTEQDQSPAPVSIEAIEAQEKENNNNKDKQKHEDKQPDAPKESKPPKEK